MSDAAVPTVGGARSVAIDMAQAAVFSLHIPSRFFSCVLSICRRMPSGWTKRRLFSWKRWGRARALFLFDLLPWFGLSLIASFSDPPFPHLPTPRSCSRKATDYSRCTAPSIGCILGLRAFATLRCATPCSAPAKGTRRSGPRPDLHLSTPYPSPSKQRMPQHSRAPRRQTQTPS